MTSEKLLAEQKKIEARMRRRNEQAQADQKRLYEIKRLLEKAELAKLTGIERGVKIGIRFEPGNPAAKLNHAVGTLVKVNRTCALVDFGELGKWNWPINELVAADARQGVTMEAMMSGDMGDA